MLEVGAWGPSIKVRKDLSLIFNHFVTCHTNQLFPSSALNFNERRPLLSMSVSCDGQMIAAGTEANSEDASIVFW